MEKILSQAACTGDMEALFDSVRADAAVIQKLHSHGHAETPLHLACMFGHLQFVRDYMILGSISFHQLCQRNGDGYSPLHLAASNGHVEIIKHLINFGQQNFVVDQMCLSKDRDGKTMIHSATVTGRVDVIDVLLEDCPESALEVTFHQDNILHLAVKHHQYEALEFLIQKLGSFGGGLLNQGDREGNTILHLATAGRQFRVVECLVKQPGLEINALNSYGLTPLDVMFVCATKDVYIEEALILAGGGRSQMQTTTVQATAHQTPSSSKKDEERRKNEQLRELRNAVFVMASLVLTLVFQVALSPPGGVWQERDPSFATSSGSSTRHIPGRSILYDLAKARYRFLMVVNLQAFIASIVIIIVLLLPFRARIWFQARAVVLMALFYLAIEFFLILSLTTPENLFKPTYVIANILWPLMIYVLVFAVPWVLDFIRRRRRRNVNSST